MLAKFHAFNATLLPDRQAANLEKVKQWILDDNARQMPAPYTEAAPGNATSGGYGRWRVGWSLAGRPRMVRVSLATGMSGPIKRIDHVVAVVENFEVARLVWLEAGCPVVYDGALPTHRACCVSIGSINLELLSAE